ncbi:MAG: WcaF family extracellular polysaccharide biosynthesis acetyltransferase [Spirosomataceae bacterium]
MKVDLSRYDNSWYQHGPLGKRLAWTIVSIAFFESKWPWPTFLKIGLLSFFGAHIGKGVVIKPEVKIKYPWRLNVQDHVWIGEKVWIDNLEQVTIESHVCISQGAMLLTGNHNYSQSTFDLMVGAIHLKQGSWIGAWSIVCPNVTCGEHSILSVQSVATKDLLPWGIYQGNPAQFKKTRAIVS